MPLQPIFEDINLTQRQGSVKERIKVECKTDVPSGNVRKILNVSARSVVTHSEASDTAVSFEGRTTFFICYENDDGSIEKCECGSEFKGEIKTNGSDNCRAMVFSEVEKTEADISGVKLGVVAYLCLDVNLYDCKRTKALVGGEELITDVKEINYLKGYGFRESVFPIEEQFEIDCVVEDVLSQRAQAVITAVQCGVGCIIVDGEVLLSAILLQSKEKKDIIRENKVLPFRAEIECEDAMPQMLATAFVKEKSFKTDISVEEDGGKSVVNASIVLALSGEVYSSQSLVVASDVFSIKEEIDIEKEDCCFYQPCDVRSESKEVVLSANVDPLSAGSTLVACSGERVEVISVTCEKDLVASCVAYTTVFFKDGDGVVFTRKIETPFELNLDLRCEKECDYNVRAYAHKCRARLLSDSQLEISMQVFATAYPFEKCSVGLVKQVSSLGEKAQNTHAISVYIPNKGETLWSLAKRLNVSPETLINTNQDLQFPLSGKERIVVYRQI